MGAMPEHTHPDPNVCPSCEGTVEAVKQRIFDENDIYFVHCSECTWVHDAEYSLLEIDALGILQRRDYEQYIPQNVTPKEHQRINRKWATEWVKKGNSCESPIVVIDLFCGAGGTTTGIHRAVVKGNAVAEVIACVNHSPKAIMSHEANYPNCQHFMEDLTKLDVKRLPAKAQYKDATVVLWLSPDCTSHSNAKNGPKNRSSRMLPRQAYRYIKHINPDVVMVENVREFQTKWGPLTESDMPDKKKQGMNYMKWRKTICRLGYKYNYRHMNAADYGGYTSRVRYFGMFVKESSGLPLVFPQPTHDKKEKYGLPKWKPVREVLDLQKEGLSIFSPERKRPLVENTMKRIYKGLVKHVEKSGKGEWIVKYLSNNQKTGVNAGASVDEPCHTVTGQARLGLAQCQWMVKYNNSKGEPNAGSSTAEPAHTLTGKCHQGLASAQFIYDYQGKANAVKSADGSAPTIMGKDTLGKIDADFILNNQFQTMPKSTDELASTILTNNKLHLVRPELPDRSHFLYNPQWGGHTHEVDKPCFTIIARMDKTPPHLVITESGKVMVAINEGDSEYTKLIKQFMNKYGIVDIKMRMLLIPELLRIQGFGDQYILCGSQTDQKKFIGNSVHPTIPEHWFAAFYSEVIDVPVKSVGQAVLFI